MVKDLHKKKCRCQENLYTDDFNEILNDDEIKIVVEVMGGIEPARDYILKSMDKKSMVSANKAQARVRSFERAESKGNVSI